MIKSYRFKNFSSYLDDADVDFTVTSKTSPSYYDVDVEGEGGSKVSKVAGVFGANGAGKSNLLKPLAFLSWFIMDSFRDSGTDDYIPFKPHFSAQDEGTEIEVEFCHPMQADGSGEMLQFRYFVKMKRNAVLKEELKVKSSRLYSTIFLREYDEEQKGYRIKKNNKYLSAPLKILGAAPSNCSLMSYLFRLGFEEKWESKEVIKQFAILFLASHTFGYIFTNLSNEGTSSFSSRLMDSTVFLSKNNEVLEQVKKLLLNYDLGMSDLIIEDTTVVLDNGDEVVKPMAFCLHEHNGEKYRLPLHQESSGTISAYCLLVTIAQTLSKGGVAVLDEFDNDLHPDFALEIMELFKSDSTNPKNAQLLFTSHTTDLLKSLKKQHLHLVEKHGCESESYRADEISGLKDRDNLYVKYVNGALGAVPSYS